MEEVLRKKRFFFSSYFVLNAHEYLQEAFVEVDRNFKLQQHI